MVSLHYHKQLTLYKLLSNSIIRVLFAKKKLFYDNWNPAQKAGFLVSIYSAGIVRSLTFLNSRVTVSFFCTSGNCITN